MALMAQMHQIHGRHPGHAFGLAAAAVAAREVVAHRVTEHAIKCRGNGISRPRTHCNDEFDL
jgi:hypothetical protein